MKVYPINRRYREETPPLKKSLIVDHSAGKKPVDTRKRSITPISQEVMEYYENLLKEHNQSGARQSRIEYRIF